MDAKVKAYIDKGKKILNENAELEEEGRAYDKRQKLIELGIFTKGKEIYTDEYNNDDPDCEWVEERNQWRSVEIIVPEVTDEEFEQILESERIQKEDAVGKSSGPKVPFATDEKDNKRSAEKFLSACASGSLVLAVVILILGIVLSAKADNWEIFVGAVFLAALYVGSWALLKVICNVSNNLHDLNEKVKKQ